MKATNLIAGLSLDPNALKAVGQAFDAAWAVVAPKYEQADPLIIENARFALAQAVIAAHGTCGNDVEALKAAALGSTSPFLQL